MGIKAVQCNFQSRFSRLAVKSVSSNFHSSSTLLQSTVQLGSERRLPRPIKRKSEIIFRASVAHGIENLVTLSCSNPFKMCSASYLTSRSSGKYTLVKRTRWNKPEILEMKKMVDLFIVKMANFEIKYLDSDNVSCKNSS